MKTSAIGGKATTTGTVDLATLFGPSAGASGVSGAFTTSVAAAAGQTYSLTVDGVSVFTFTSAAAADDVTAAEVDSGVTTATAGLNAQGITVTGTAAAGTLAFTKTDGSDFDIVVANTMATTPGGFAGTDFNTGTSSITSGTPEAAYAVGQFDLTIGSNDLVSMAGTYDTAQDFVDAINSNVSGAYASLDDSGHLELSSTEEMVVAAGAGTTALGVTAGTLSPTGNLTTVNVLTVDDANDAIQRADSALTAVSTLRSTMGAIQNRFQSTINSLQAVSENLAASRSRILDTDFAAETAALTRAQILQQAGTAMVAQANAIPQNVLTLLQ